MPKGWKPKPTEEERLSAIAEETRRIIEHAMVDQGIRYQKDLADLVGMQRATLSEKLKRGTWTQRDLCKIRAVLKIPAEESIKMLGVKRKRQMKK